MRQYYLRQKKAGGMWYAIIMNTTTGKQKYQRSTKTNDKNKANEIAQDWLINGLPDSTKAKKGTAQQRNMLFCDFLYDFWDFENSEYIKEKITEGSQPQKSYPKEMQRVINRYFRSYFGNTLLSEITEEKLTEFLVYLKNDKIKERKTVYETEPQKGLAASTVKKAKNAAIVPLRFAKRKKIIKSFDFDAVIKPDGDYLERGIPDPDTIDALFKLKWRSKKAYLICKIASQTTARLGEIRALRVFNILDNKIDYFNSWNEDVGLKCTKNRAKRTIPILPELHREIINYIKQEKLDTNLNNFIFPGKNIEKPFSQKQVEKEFYLMLEELGISDKERRKLNIVFHSFRHYGAKHLAENTDRITGMAILGHKTPNLFDKYSNHADKETFSKMTKAIQDSFGKKVNDKSKTILFPTANNQNQGDVASVG